VFGGHRGEGTEGMMRSERIWCRAASNLLMHRDLKAWW
jgi:hypothetical protein